MDAAMVTSICNAIVWLGIIALVGFIAWLCER